MEQELLKSNLGNIIESVLDDYKKGRDIDKTDTFNQPDKEAIIDITLKLQRILYPGYYRENNYKIYSVENSLVTIMEDVAYNLIKQLAIVLKYREDCEGKSTDEVQHLAEEIALSFLAQIPKVREYLDTDLDAAYDGDPAAYSKDEIIFSYPGMKAISIYRLAHELYLLNVPILPRIMTEYAHSLTGIDINPGATIGKYFFIDHGTGIVVGETTIIGENVKIYQGVTIGALSTSGGQSLKSTKRHPTIEDNVTIYSGASILGGKTVIGHDSVIGGNTFITESVAPGSRMTAR